MLARDIKKSISNRAGHSRKTQEKYKLITRITGALPLICIILKIRMFCGQPGFKALEMYTHHYCHE